MRVRRDGIERRSRADQLAPWSMLEICVRMSSVRASRRSTAATVRWRGGIAQAAADPGTGPHDRTERDRAMPNFSNSRSHYSIAGKFREFKIPTRMLHAISDDLQFFLGFSPIDAVGVIRMQSGPATPILFSIAGLLLAVAVLYGQAQMSRHGIKIAMPYQFEDTDNVIQVAALD